MPEERPTRPAQAILQMDDEKELQFLVDSFHEARADKVERYNAVRWARVRKSTEGKPFCRLDRDLFQAIMEAPPEDTPEPGQGKGGPPLDKLPESTVIKIRENIPEFILSAGPEHEEEEQE